MSKKIESLKQQYPELGVSWIDFLARIDKTKTKKYLPLICKIATELVGDEVASKNDIKHVFETRGLPWELFNDLPLSTLRIGACILTNFPVNVFPDLISFQEYMERGLIENKDVQTYKSHEDIKQAVSIAHLKATAKELEKQIIKVHEDEIWLFIKPLTFEASARYGSGTKWCTTNKSNFIRYWQKGQLVYILNKKNGVKQAMFHSLNKKESELSFWNATDKRIDFLELEIDDYLVPIIKQILKDNKTNEQLCNEKEADKVWDECNPNVKVKAALREILAQTAREMEQNGLLQRPPLLGVTQTEEGLDQITWTPGEYTPVTTNTDGTEVINGTEVITDPIVTVHINHIPGIDIPVVSAGDLSPHLNNDNIGRLQNVFTEVNRITGLNLGYNNEERAE
jgi:hypothetical protein